MRCIQYDIDNHYPVKVTLFDLSLAQSPHPLFSHRTHCVNNLCTYVACNDAWKWDLNAINCKKTPTYVISKAHHVQALREGQDMHDAF